MAKEVIWTETAVIDRYKIYQFWLSHNRSEIYSDKLENLFNEAAKLLAQFPEIGTTTDYEDIRVKTVRNYKLFYRNNFNRIEIIRVWDTLQNPDNIKIG